MRICLGIFLSLAISNCGLTESKLLGCHNQSLSIVEFLPNPHGPDNQNEWLKLLNSGTQPINLAEIHLRIGTPNRRRKIWLFKPPHQPVMLPATAYVLITHNKTLQILSNNSFNLTMAPNSWLQLPNRHGHLQVQCGEQTLSSLSYGPGSLLPLPQSGHSLQFDGDTWCQGRAAIADSQDKGNPTSINPPCSQR